MKERKKIDNKKENVNSEFIIEVKKLNPKVELPSYLYDTDAGFDLRATQTVKLFPGEQKEVRTGLFFKIPIGTVGLIRDRVGIITKMGVHTVAGTFDQGFRGEISIFLVNLSEQTQFVEEGMRIAQMILIPVIRPKIVEVKKLEDTLRGNKSFASTGLKELKKLSKEIKKKK